MIALTVTDVATIAPGAFVLGIVLGLVLASYWAGRGP